MARFTEIGVRATAEGVDQLIFKLGAMNKAITASGAAGAASAGGISLMSAALGIVVAGAIAAVAAIAAVTAGLFTLGKAGVDTASSVESAFAGVLKTTTGLGTNLFDLTDAGEEVFQQFRDMTKEIPLAFEELAEIGQFVGQLGFAEDQIAGVTETVAAVTVSTDLVAKQAALHLSRFANVMSQTGEVSTETFENIASDLVFLGNKYSALESEIILTARNIAGSASLFGFTEDAVLGMGTAVIKAGVTAEAGGSAIMNTITEIGKAVLKGGEKLDVFAATAGLSAEEFARVWETDANEAFTLFVEGLETQGTSAILALDDLDLAQRRSIRTLLGISRSGVKFREIMDDSAMAIQDNTWLTREAEIRYNTFDSQVKILKNRLRDMGITIGLELIPRLLELVDKVGPILDALGENLEPIIKQVADTIQEQLMPALGDLLDAFGIDLSAEGIITGIQNLGQSISDHIEDFSIFIGKVAELVELSREKGLAGFLEGIGIPEEFAEGFADAAIAIGAFILATKGINLAAAGLAGLSAVLTTGFIANTAAFFALVGEAGLAASIGLLINPVIGLAAALVALGVAIAGIDEEDMEMFKGLGEQTGTIFSLLQERQTAELESQRESLLAFLGGVKDALVEFFSVTLPESVAEMSAGISLWAQNVVTAMSTFFGETFPTFVTDLTTIIADTAAEFVTSFGGKISKFWVTESNKLKVKFRDAGADVVKGFVKGMKMKIEWAIAEIQTMAQALVDAANGVFANESPSKVFAEMGENIMLGLGKGIKDMAFEPQTAITSSMNNIVSSGMQSVPASSVASSSLDRSFNVGDINMTTQPESPNSVALTMQRLALMQAGAS